jgi:hypothetical protein
VVGYQIVLMDIWRPCQFGVICLVSGCIELAFVKEEEEGGLYGRAWHSTVSSLIAVLRVLPCHGYKRVSSSCARLPQVS